MRLSSPLNAICDAGGGINGRTAGVFGFGRKGSVREVTELRVPPAALARARRTGRSRRISFLPRPVEQPREVEELRRAVRRIPLLSPRACEALSAQSLRPAERLHVQTGRAGSRPQQAPHAPPLRQRGGSRQE